VVCSGAGSKLEEGLPFVRLGPWGLRGLDRQAGLGWLISQTSKFGNVAADCLQPKEIIPNNRIEM
jgi:hypothetical protein